MLEVIDHWGMQQPAPTKHASLHRRACGRWERVLAHRQPEVDGVREEAAACVVALMVAQPAAAEARQRRGAQRQGQRQRRWQRPHPLRHAWAHPGHCLHCHMRRVTASGAGCIN